jgi:uncharacterized Zn-binding protein involved in type VI secretion
MKLTFPIALAILLGISFSSYAQTGTLTPVPPDAVPQIGTFYSSQNWPPMPFDWAPDLPVYSLGNGSFVIEDSSVNYADPASWGGTWPRGGGEGARSMDDSGVPAPPGDGGSTNLSGGGVFSSDASFSTNGLWMKLNGITNGIVSLTLNNGTDMVYEVWSTESLTNSLTNWTIEQAVWPVTNQTSTLFTVEVQDHTNGLFFGARDWTGITSDGNQTPEWWFFYYFGTVDLTDSDLDSSGNTLWRDYQNNLDPNVIYFAVNVTNQYFNTSSATVQTAILGGVPFYMAALVDSSDCSNANWTPFNSNLVVNLGSVEGWHTVSVGLRGLPSNAQQTWEQIQLKLVLTPPVLVITNPIVGIVTQPFIQLQGYSLGNLASMSYDLSNSASFETNQQAFVTTRQFDTNTFEYMTNCFQCFNIPLANGTNTVTLHAKDMAGNVTITNVTYGLDPSANTNPPVINLSWPPNNASISGANFPVRGVVNDPFSTVNAQIVNGGSTSHLTGLVEQNGSFWIENVPIGSGTNYLTIMATNTAGYGSATNIVVVQSTITLTIDSVSFNDPATPTATVNGTLSGSSDNVLVNGVEATNNGDGTWTAFEVPVGDSGTAAITAEATANTGSGDGDSNNAGYSVDAAENGASSGADAQIAEDVVRGPEIAWVEYRQNGTYNGHGGAQYNSSIWSISENWAYGSPGDFTSWDCISSGGALYTLGNWDANGDGPGYTGIDDDCTTVCQTNGLFTICLNENFDILPPSGENLSMHISGIGPPETFTEQYHDQSRYVLRTGGQATPGHDCLWVFNVTAFSYVGDVWWGLYNITTWIPPSQITVAGHTLDANGNVYLSLPNNAEADVTPNAPVGSYFWNTSGPNTVSLYSLTVVSNSATQIDATNWAVVKTNGFVTIQANLSDPNAGSHINWSGGGQAVPGNPLQWQVSAATSEKTTVTASLGSSKVSLNVWVLWSTVNILTSGPVPTDTVTFVIAGLSNILGPVYYGGGTWACGQICAVASITPAGIHNLITNGWYLNREVWDHSFKDGVPLIVNNTNWTSDTINDYYQSASPDSADNFYGLDGPNIVSLGATNCTEFYENFHQWLTWNGILVSDGTPGTSAFPVAAEWHWSATWQSTATPQVFFLNLGGGYINLPNTAAGCPP